MEKKQIDENLEYLIRCILTLETPEECLHFLEDLCTTSELFELSRRLQAAKMLHNNVIYTEIAKQTGLSTATISRVNRCLKFDRSGYQTVFKRTARKK